MNKLTKWRRLAVFLLLFLTAVGGYLATGKTIQVIEDGKMIEYNTHALTVEGALRSSGISLKPGDVTHPGRYHILLINTSITVDHTRPVTILSPEHEASITFESAERKPQSLLRQAGVNWKSADRILWNGLDFPADQDLPAASSYTLQVLPGRILTIQDQGKTIQIDSTASTVGSALWQAGIVLSESDRVSVSMESPVDGAGEVRITRSVPIAIKTFSGEIPSRTSADTVGKALAEAGISLQGQDYSIPAEDQPLPADGILQVVRVTEQVELEQTAIPYESEYVENPELELDQRAVLEAGQYGIEVTRVRIRFEDGLETARQTESQWTAANPRPEKIGYGTKIVIRTLDTPGGPLEYWRAVPVYATSYSPCRSGTTKCYSGTASGRPVARGVIGVTRQWYNLLANQPVYVPGYGAAVIGDVGGGVSGEYWIDLGFTDDDFETWHQNTTLYFLTPVPAAVPWILP